jgi:hypothetical protein
MTALDATLGTQSDTTSKTLSIPTCRLTGVVEEAMFARAAHLRRTNKANKVVS